MPRKTFIEVRCPVCQSENHRSLGIAPVSETFRYVLAKEVDIPPVTVVRCQYCGLYYVRPMPSLTLEQYNQLYSIDYFRQNTPW